MSRKSCIITLGLLLGLLVACSAEPQVVEVTVEVEVTSEVEVIKEVEVEAEPFPTPPINLTTAPGDNRFGEGAAELIAEDEQSTGQEDQSRPTPFVPRDKEFDSTQSSQTNLTQNTQAVQNNTEGAAVVETSAETAVVVDSADSSSRSETTTQSDSPRSEDEPTATPIINTSTPIPPATSTQLTTPSPTMTQAPLAQPDALMLDLSRWVVLTCGTFH